MRKSIFQHVADWIQGIKTPEWLKALLYEIQIVIMGVLRQFSADYVASVKGKIVEVAGQDMPSGEKRDIVLKYAISLGGNYKERAIRALIENLVNLFKEKGIID